MDENSLLPQTVQYRTCIFWGFGNFHIRRWDNGIYMHFFFRNSNVYID